MSWDLFSLRKFHNYFIPTTDKVKTQRMLLSPEGWEPCPHPEWVFLCCLCREFSAWPLLPEKESQQLTQSNWFTLVKLNCWETKAWQHFPKIQLQYHKLNKLLFVSSRLFYFETQYVQQTQLTFSTTFKTRLEQ